MIITGLTTWTMPRGCDVFMNQFQTSTVALPYNLRAQVNSNIVATGFDPMQNFMENIKPDVLEDREIFFGDTHFEQSYEAYQRVIGQYPDMSLAEKKTSYLCKILAPFADLKRNSAVHVIYHRSVYGQNIITAADVCERLNLMGLGFLIYIDRAPEIAIRPIYHNKSTCAF